MLVCLHDGTELYDVNDRQDVPAAQPVRIEVVSTSADDDSEWKAQPQRVRGRDDRKRANHATG